MHTIMQGMCERQKSVMKKWVPCWIRVSNKDILVSDTENTHPRYSCTYVEILLIRRARYNNIRRFCIVVQTKRNAFWFAFRGAEEADQWYYCMNQAWKEDHTVFTEALTTPSFLHSSSSHLTCSSDNGSELDPELSLIMCKLQESTNQSDIKTFLMDIESYQNRKPIEIVVTQKAFVASFFAEFKKSKQYYLNSHMLSYIDNLVDGFDDTMIDVDPISMTELEASEVNINDILSIGDILGHGKYGVVRKAVILNTNEVVAVKIIRKIDLNEKDVGILKRECRIMYELRTHPHIISLKDFCQDAKHYYIIEELAEGGELFDAILNRKSYSEREAQNVVRTLLYTLRFCHEKGIVHRDLKPENVLLKSPNDWDHIKIADFGFATHTNGMQSLRTICGTPGYSAPEIIRGERYGAAVDLWSLGVITYILLCGYPPFPQSNDYAALRMVVNGDYHFHEQEWSGVSDEAKEFISALLVPNPARRATAKQACGMRWMQFESTRTMHMNVAVQQLARFNARRKDRQPCVPGMEENGWHCDTQFVSLTNCGVRDNPSLARGMISMIPAKMQVLAKEVIYTNEGTWALLNDESNRNWLLVEKRGYDPMCYPSGTRIYRSLFSRGKAVHNIRNSPSMKGTVIGKIPSGVLFLGSEEVTNMEGIWLVLHRQTLHSYDISLTSPCFLSVFLYPNTRFAERLE